MSKPAAIVLNPRKMPVQARSTASVDAILEATLQVLVQVGKERLTTTQVAARAGVSVGTLYQYFPNKSALLQGALKQHFDQVTNAVLAVCEEQAGRSLQEMVRALVTAFLQAKMRDGKSSVALYAVSSDLDGMEVARQIGVVVKGAILAMFATAREPLQREPELVVSILLGAMSGVSRRLLECDDPQRNFCSYLDELISLTTGYVESCQAR